MYKVVYAFHPDFFEVKTNLEISVRSLQEDGWIPQGGISVLKDGIWYKAFQAMVKNE